MNFPARGDGQCSSISQVVGCQVQTQLPLPPHQAHVCGCHSHPRGLRPEQGVGAGIRVTTKVASAAEAQHLALKPRRVGQKLSTISGLLGGCTGWPQLCAMAVSWGPGARGTRRWAGDGSSGGSPWADARHGVRGTATHAQLVDRARQAKADRQQAARRHLVFLCLISHQDHWELMEDIGEVGPAHVLSSVCE